MAIGVKAVSEERGFLTKVLNFMGIQEENAAADDGQDEPKQTRIPVERNVVEVDEARRRGRLVGLPGSGRAGAGRMRVCVVEPRAFEDVQGIADHLKDRQAVIVSLEGLDTDLATRIVDFVSGSTYALDGQVQKIGDQIFLFAPNNVEIAGTPAVEGRSLFS